LAGWAGTQYSNITDWAAYGDDDISESGFAWGVGISTEIYDNFEVFADYLVKYDLGDESVLPYGDFDNDIISVGVNYKF
jgi:opacity protein-like surface antigen